MRILDQREELLNLYDKVEDLTSENVALRTSVQHLREVLTVNCGFNHTYLDMLEKKGVMLKDEESGF